MLFWQACMWCCSPLHCSRSLLSTVVAVGMNVGNRPSFPGFHYPSVWWFQPLMTTEVGMASRVFFLILSFFLNVYVEFFCKECYVINQGYLVSRQSFHLKKKKVLNSFLCQCMAPSDLCSFHLSA